MADFPPFAFTTQESWYGELSFKAAEDGSALSLAGRQFEMWITPATSGAQLIPPMLVLTMDEGRGLTFKRTVLGADDPSTIVFRVPKETANAFSHRGEFTADLLEVVEGERYLFMPVRITYAEPSGLRTFLTRFLGVSVSFAARQQPIYTPLAVPGREGRPGATILRGTVPPVPADGKDGDYYIEDRTASGQGRRMWGPKAGGAWPGTPWNIQVAAYTDVPGLTGELNNRLRLDTDQALDEPLRARGRLNLGLGAAALLNTVAAGVKALRDGDGTDLSASGRLMSAWFSDTKNAAAYVKGGDTGIGQAINRAILAAGNAGVVRVPPGTYANPGDILIASVGRGSNGSTGGLVLDMRGVIFTGTGSVVVRSSKRVVIRGLDAKGYTLSMRGMWLSRIEDCNFDVIAFGDGAGIDFNNCYWNAFDNVGFSLLRFIGETNANTFRTPNMRGNATQGWATAREYAFEFEGDSHVQALRVIGGDVSYYSSGIYRVGAANTTKDVDLTFEGGTYFDTTAPQPYSGRRNVRISTLGAFFAQPKALVSAPLAAAVQGDQEGWAGTGECGWRALAGVNFIGNGDLARALPSYVGTNLPISGAGGATITEKTDGGTFGRYLNVNQAATASNSVFFQAANLPFAARYSGAFIVRLAGGAAGSKALQFQTNGEFFGATVTGEWAFVAWSPSAQVAAGSPFSMSISTTDSTPFNIDIAYVGVTMGARPPLLARSRPAAVPTGSVAVAAQSIAANATSSTYAISVPGVRKGDGVVFGYSASLGLAQIVGEVTADNQVTCYIKNHFTGVAVNVTAGNITARGMPAQQ